MRAVRIVRRAARSNAERMLSLPPGYRASFSAQAGAHSSRALERGSATVSDAIQNTDPDSEDYGQPFFQLGLDDLTSL